MRAYLHTVETEGQICGDTFSVKKGVTHVDAADSESAHGCTRVEQHAGCAHLVFFWTSWGRMTSRS